MKKLLARIVKNLQNRRQRPIPVTDAALNALIDAAIESAGLDPANDSIRQAVASTLLSLPNGVTHISVNQLRSVINQARLKQASYTEIERIRAVDKAKRLAEEATKNLDAESSDT